MHTVTDMSHLLVTCCNFSWHTASSHTWPKVDRCRNQCLSALQTNLQLPQQQAVPITNELSQPFARVSPKVLQATCVPQLRADDNSMLSNESSNVSA